MASTRALAAWLALGLTLGLLVGAGEAHRRSKQRSFFLDPPTDGHEKFLEVLDGAGLTSQAEVMDFMARMSNCEQIYETAPEQIRALNSEVEFVRPQAQRRRQAASEESPRINGLGSVLGAIFGANGGPQANCKRDCLLQCFEKEPQCSPVERCPAFYELADAEADCSRQATCAVGSVPVRMDLQKSEIQLLEGGGGGGSGSGNGNGNSNANEGTFWDPFFESDTEGPAEEAPATGGEPAAPTPSRRRAAGARQQNRHRHVRAATRGRNHRRNKPAARQAEVAQTGFSDAMYFMEGPGNNVSEHTCRGLAFYSSFMPLDLLGGKEELIRWANSVVFAANPKLSSEELREILRLGVDLIGGEFMDAGHGEPAREPTDEELPFKVHWVAKAIWGHVLKRFQDRQEACDCDCAQVDTRPCSAFCPSPSTCDLQGCSTQAASGASAGAAGRRRGKSARRNWKRHG